MTKPRTEIQILELSPTEEQENPCEDFELGCSEATGNDGVEAEATRNDGVEAVGIGPWNSCDSTPIQVDEESEMVTAEYLIIWNSPSPPLSFAPSSILMVPYYGSGESPMDKLLEKRQQRPANSGDQSDMATVDFDVTGLLDFPPSPPPPTINGDQSDMATVDFDVTSLLDFPPSPPPPTINGDRSDMASGEDFIIVNLSPSPPFFSALSSPLQPSPPLYFPSSFNSTVVYPPSPPPSPPPRSPSPANLMDNPLQNQQHHPLTPAAPPISRNNPYAGISYRPTNSGESDSATEDVDVMSFLNLSQRSPPHSQSPSDPPVYDRSPPHSQFPFDRPLYVAGYMALLRPWLFQFFIDESVNLPQNGLEECPGISLLYLYVEDEFFKLYLHGESWERLKVYFYRDSLMFPLVEILWVWPFQVENPGHAFFASVHVSIGMWRIGPREWVAKIRYQRRSLPMPFFMSDQGRYNVNLEVYFRNKQVILEDARLNFPDLLQIYRKAELIFREKNPNMSYDEEGIIQLVNERVTYDTNSTGVAEDPSDTNSTGVAEDPGEDFVNGAESQLNPVPFENRKGETPKGERGKKKTTRVRNVIPLENILQVTKMHFKGAPGNLKGVRLENPDENSCNDEVEAVGMGGVGTGEGEVKDGELNSGSSDKGERNEKIPQAERANNKGTGVRTEIPLEEILKCKDMCRKDAAACLKVSESTLKQILREYNIPRWSRHELNKLIVQSHPNESPLDVDQEQIHQLNCDTELRSNQASTETNSVTVKAKYETVTIKFRLSRPWRMVELEENVKKRLGLEVGTYHTEYKDEDGDLILISCDEDLKNCIPNSSPLGTCLIWLFLRQSSS